MDTNHSSIKNKIIIIKFSFLIIVFVFSFFIFSAPINNNKLNTLHVSSSDTIYSISNILKEKKIIRNSFIFKSLVFLLDRDGNIDIGDYLFTNNSSVFVVAWQLSYGKHNINPLKITLREGLTNKKMALILSNKLNNFNKDKFLKKVKDKQGYLFPDTYFFYPNDTMDEVINKLSNNFEKKLSKLEEFINLNNKSLSDSIIMASIIEKEAHGEDDAYIISGILWKRIKLGIPLQVDVDKSTYKIKGLPSKPIGNPGFRSIKASLNPASSPYLYYIHEKNGTVHFAKNFKEHKRNIRKYLK